MHGKGHQGHWRYEIEITAVVSADGADIAYLRGLELAERLRDVGYVESARSSAPRHRADLDGAFGKLTDA